MNNVVQMPLVHVMGNSNAAGNQKTLSKLLEAAGGESFLTQLHSLLSGEQSQDTQVMKPEIGTLALIYSNLVGEKLPEEEMDMDQMISIFIGVLFQSSESMKEDTLQNAEMQKWLNDAEKLLKSLNLEQSQTYNFKTVSTDVLQLSSKSSVELQAQFEQIQKVMVDFLKSVQQSPQNTQLQEHAQSLKELLKPLIEAIQQSNQSNASEQSKLISALQQSSGSHLGQNSLFHQMNSPSDPKMNTAFQNGKGESISSLNGLASIQMSSEESNANTTMMNKANMLLNKTIFMSGLTMDNTPQEKVVPITTDNTIIQPLTQETARLLTTEQTQSAKSVPTYMQAQNFAEQAGPFLIKHMKIAQANGISEARISLVPEHLGQVNIRISMQNGHMVAQFMTESIMGKEMLEGQLSQLRTVLQNQGIQVDKLEVSQSQSQNSNLFQESRQQSSKQFLQQNKDKKSEYDTINDDFSLDFRDDITHKSRVYGSSFDAMA